MAEVSKVRLTELIKVWDILHVKDTGEIGFCDLDNALQKAGVIIHNDVSGCQPAPTGAPQKEGSSD